MRVYDVTVYREFYNKNILFTVYIIRLIVILSIIIEYVIINTMILKYRLLFVLIIYKVLLLNMIILNSYFSWLNKNLILISNIL